MKTGIALGFICFGAILAFAVTGNTSVFNIHTAGWVIMLVGLVGLFLPKRSYGWLGRRVVVRRTRGYPTAIGAPVEEVAAPPYVAHNPGTSRIEAGLPTRPTLLTEREGTTDPIEDVENRATTYRRVVPQTEIVEDLYENPD